MFFANNIKFLGHVVGKARIRLDLDKVKTIAKFLVPRTVTNIQTFLGLIGYYHNYIRNYAKILTFLFELTKRDATLQWTIDCQEAFD